ncbi:hypothetical protein Peur_023317 [Populus x canadensis]
MATVTASHVVSSSSNVSSHGSETKASLSQIGLRSQSMTHSGLRSLNMADKLQMRTQAFARKSVKKAYATWNDTSGKIVCLRGGMTVVFVGIEVAPWSKTGGLGDVIGGLPPEMAARGHRVMTISPRFDQYRDAWDTCLSAQIKVGDRIETVRYFHCYKRGVDRVFVDHPMFLEKAALEAPRVLSLNSSKHFSGPYGVCLFTKMYDKPVKGRKLNWLKAGILKAQMVFTVSPYYAQELVSGIEKGMELDHCIRKTGITGIINGMDVQEWNPATDKYTSIKYDITTGTGKKYMEKQIAELEKKYPDKVRGVALFNVPLAHMIIAGADFMIIPSRFEPCGLIQLHAMRYGTVCIVASTGGLVDTVKEGYTGFHMGAFSVECDAVDPADVAAVVKTVVRALAVYGTAAFREMIKNCMSQDLSWKGPARLWEKMLLSLNVAGSEAGSEGDEIAPLAKENVATP